MVISENCCNFMVLKYKVIQTIIAMITEDKVTELFCIADDFCKFFDAMMSKYTIKEAKKRAYHRDSTLSIVTKSSLRLCGCRELFCIHPW